MTVSTGETQQEAAALAETLTNQAAAAPVQQEQTVPLHVLQSVREELKAKKDENEIYKQHLNMMQWQRPQPQQAPQEYNPFGDIDPEESIKVKDAKRVIEGLKNELKATFDSKLAEIKMTQKASDYNEVIKKYLPLAAQEDPELLQDIQNSANPYKAAYNAIKASRAYQDDMYKERASKEAPQTPQKAIHAERVINNARQSGSVSTVATNSTAGSGLPSFLTMSDDEFVKFKASRSLRPGKVR